MPKPTAVEVDIMFAVEEFWNRNRFFPGTDEISKLTKFPLDVVEEIITSGKLDKRFESLGIDKSAVPLAKKGEIGKNAFGLTHSQLALASCLLNPYDQRSRAQKLKDLGIQPITFNGWMKSDKFVNYLKEQSERMFGDMMPMAKDALLRKVLKGEVGAIKLYMEMQGEYSKSEPAQDYRLLVNRLIEAIQRHVKDPATLQALAEDIKSLTIKGEVVHGNDSPIIPELTERR